MAFGNFFHVVEFQRLFSAIMLRNSRELKRIYKKCGICNIMLITKEQRSGNDSMNEY